MPEVTQKYRFDTLALHGGWKGDPTTGARAVPIYQTTSYNFRDAKHAARLFNLEESGNIYTRIMNPTTSVFEERVALLENGVGSVATSSGQAAITLALTNIAGAGDEIVSSPYLYGGTYSLFRYTFSSWGIKVHYVDSLEPEKFLRKAGPATKAFYVETIGNPGLIVPDLEVLGEAAREVGVPLIVDNTFATPYLCRPLEHGAHVVIHSATKFIGGHGSSIGGVIVDGGNFPWDTYPQRFPGLCTPNESYHGLVFTERFGKAAYIAKVRTHMLRDLGASLSPFNAFLFVQGLETLSLRMERHCANARAVIQFLEKRPEVSWISYPELPQHPSFEMAKKYLPRGAGAILTFGLKSGLSGGRKFIESLKLFSHLANVGDARSLAIHPASTTHAQLSPEEQERAGVTGELIRLSIGLEDPLDLCQDLEEALKASAKP